MSVYDAKNPELSKVPSHVYNILDLVIIYSLASFSHLQKAIATTGHKLCSRKSTSFCEFVLREKHDILNTGARVMMTAKRNLEIVTDGKNDKIEKN